MPHFKQVAISPTARLIGGPLNGEVRFVDPVQRYQAWTQRDPKGAWRWYIYEVKRKMGQKEFEFKFTGTVKGTQPDFSYHSGDIRINGKTPESQG